MNLQKHNGVCCILVLSGHGRKKRLPKPVLKAKDAALHSSAVPFANFPQRVGEEASWPCSPAVDAEGPPRCMP